jgi:hypothetical protein
MELLEEWDEPLRGEIPSSNHKARQVATLATEEELAGLHGEWGVSSFRLGKLGNSKKAIYIPSSIRTKDMRMKKMTTETIAGIPSHMVVLRWKRAPCSSSPFFLSVVSLCTLSGYLQKAVTAKEILEFRQAFKLILTDYPFALAFGIANTIEACIKSSYAVFDRLVSKQSEHRDTLLFDTVSAIASTPLTVEQATASNRTKPAKQTHDLLPVAAFGRCLGRRRPDVFVHCRYLLETVRLMIDGAV